MQIKIDIPEYKPHNGIQIIWQDGFHISVKLDESSVIIAANKAGLISLATHFLTMAQDNVNPGTHIHYDEYNALEKDSTQFIIEKVC